MQLARRLARGPVDHAPTLHGRPRQKQVGPALDGTRLAGSVSGACRPVARSPWPPPLAPRTPPPVARPRSLASQLLWRGLTPRPRASSASARRLPDADRSPHARPRSRSLPVSAGGVYVHARVFVTQDRTCARVDAHPRFAFRCDNGVGVPIAQWLAYTHPCRRFAPGLATDDAPLGADAVRYSFIVVDLHHLLLAGLPAHCRRNSCLPSFSRNAFPIPWAKVEQVRRLQF